MKSPETQQQNKLYVETHSVLNPTYHARYQSWKKEWNSNRKLNEVIILSNCSHKEINFSSFLAEKMTTPIQFFDPFNLIRESKLSIPSVTQQNILTKRTEQSK